MSHEDIFLYLGASKACTMQVGIIQLGKIDGKFFSRAFTDANNHLLGDMHSSVFCTRYAFYLLDVQKLFSYLFKRHWKMSWLGSDGRW